ncbi:MAG TPA: adenosylcobalamin-dependent ribonucleoside-diphosphate reductase [Candidatus Angelobacter sp.]|nr:adenosylcobalamin-dependent ribonucleoside-diphosphate reductase [Candidatus Angelobacter sp.]
MPQVAAISQQIWDMKYRLKDAGGGAVDRTIEDSWRRVATTLAAPEKDPALWTERFYEAMADFKFLPAGRILAGAGTKRNVTLFNCFVMGTVPDDMRGIFENLLEAALTMQQGGGIGYDFSTLRPKGAPVKGVGADASGPLTFMDVWDAMCRTIMSAGHRRGAMMATMRCDHPDIEAFIEAKREAGRLRMFNLSVLVTDAFMTALKEDAPWELKFGGTTFKVLRARDLWDKVMRATYAFAEPGVIFIDRINRRNNLHYCELISATNPCGEEPLPPYGACLLGSINLAALVRSPFGAEARLDMAELERLVPIAVRLMDNVVDVSGFPLPQQTAEAKAKRRIGLGVTGLADALIMCGARYGSSAAVSLTEIWMKAIQRAAYLASADLAAEKGSFPLYERDKFMAGENVAALDEDVRAKIAAQGMRNGTLTAIAPTGTISLFADNVSSGLEPVFSFRYARNLLMPDGTRVSEEVTDYAFRLFHKLKGETAPLPEAFVDAQQLTPGDHVIMQAAVQKYIDASISKTINCPADLSFEAFKDVYMQAYELGCKGCTTYRPNEITGAVLEVKDGKRAAPARQPELPLAPPAPAKPRDMYDSGGVVYMTQPLDRPEALPGRTYKLRWPESEHAIYVTLNDIVQDGRRRPFEIFINSKNMEHYAWTVGLTRMISAVFRRGGDVSFVVEELKAVFDPRGGSWMGGHYVPSLLAAIGEVIEQHMIDIGFMPDPARERREMVEALAERKVANLPPPGSEAAELRLPRCPRCSQPSLIRQEGCDLCTSCGYSKCS